MKTYYYNIMQWWNERKANRAARNREQRIVEIRRRYDIEIKDGNLWLTVCGETITNVPETWTTLDIIAERERFIAAALKKEGLIETEKHDHNGNEQ